MNRKLVCVAAVLCLFATACAKDARSVLQDAQESMGNPQTVQFMGTGMNAFFGQALTAGNEWPRRDLDSVNGAINYEQRSARLEFNFKNPVFGGQRQISVVNGDRAWGIAADGTTANPQLAAAELRQLQIWMTPHGFVRAAQAAGNAMLESRTEDGQQVDVITFTAMDKYKLTGTISSGLVTKVETTIPDPVLGDTPFVATYSDYMDFNGVKFPTRIVQTQGGFPVNEFTITSVEPNAAVDLAVPANVQSATVAPVVAQSSPVGPGVWFVGGGSHHSVVVEFADFLTVIEGPQNEQRSMAVIAEAKKLAPNKPIRYVVSTHHHFDHSGGLRTYVAEGATVVTHASNQAYFEKSLVAPATLAPDAQSNSPKTPMIQPVSDKYVITDGKQTVEVYNTVGDNHTDEMLIAYIPSIRAVVEADSYSPGPPTAPIPTPAPPNAVNLYDNIQRLKLNVATVIGIHGRGPVPIAELRKFVGRT
jgi:glyoxylase-like metal-dependent hydrolase (beta-lactamase superfamily II)